MCIKFRTFWKKRRVSYLTYYRSSCIRKRCFLKRLKRLPSGHHSVINVLMGWKDCWSQHGTTIFRFFHEFEINWVGNSLPKSHLESSDCLLTRWLRWQVFPSQYADFLTTTWNDFISRRKAFLWNFYCISEMCIKFRKFWKKRRVSYPTYYRSSCFRKRCLLKRLKGVVSEEHSLINVLTSSKHCWSQHGTTIFLFFHEFVINWVANCLP